MRSKLGAGVVGSIAVAFLSVALATPAHADSYTLVDQNLSGGVKLWIDDQSRDFHAQGANLHTGDVVAVFISDDSRVFEATSATAGQTTTGITLDTPPYHAAVGESVQGCVLLPSSANCTGWNQFNG